MTRVKDPDLIKSKRKALIALFPYAVQWERGRNHRMFGAYSNIFVDQMAKELVGRPIVALLDEASPDSPNWVVTLMLPYGYWGYQLKDGKNAATGWASAALAVSYTEEFGRCVVDSLLCIASNDGLLPFIPVDIWAWLKKRPSLPPKCWGRYHGTQSPVVRKVRELGDVELLESYFLLVWSEWNFIYEDGLEGMLASIREDFGGIGAWRHREILIKRLDHVLGELNRGLKHLQQQIPYLDESYIPRARRQYGGLKGELLEADREAFSTSTPFRAITLFGSLTPARMPQNLTLRSLVLSLSHVRSRVSATPAPRLPSSVLHSHTGSPLSPFDSSKDRCPALEYIRLPPPPDAKKRSIDVLSGKWISRRACHARHRSRLCIVLCNTTHRFMLLLSRILVLLSHPSPRYLQSLLNDGWISTRR